MTETIRNKHIQTLCILSLANGSPLPLPLPDHLLGFVAQESSEEFLKAFINANGRRYPFTHPLGDLLALLSELGEQLPEPPNADMNLEPYAGKLPYNLGAPLSSAERLTIRKSLAILGLSILARNSELEA